jgi:hypothetical protein
MRRLNVSKKNKQSIEAALERLPQIRDAVIIVASLFAVYFFVQAGGLSSALNDLLDLVSVMRGGLR